MPRWLLTCFFLLFFPIGNHSVSSQKGASATLTLKWFKMEKFWEGLLAFFFFWLYCSIKYYQEENISLLFRSMQVQNKKQIMNSDIGVRQLLSSLMKTFFFFQKCEKNPSNYKKKITDCLSKRREWGGVRNCSCFLVIFLTYSINIKTPGSHMTQYCHIRDVFTGSYKFFLTWLVRIIQDCNPDL